MARVSAACLVKLLRKGDKIKSLPGTRLISLVLSGASLANGMSKAEQTPIAKEAQTLCRKPLKLLASKRPAHARAYLLARNAAHQIRARASEAITFHPAIETPISDHAIASHRTGAATITSGLSRSAVLIPAMELPVQEANPSHHFCSTPT